MVEFRMLLYTKWTEPKNNLWRYKNLMKVLSMQILRLSYFNKSHKNNLPEYKSLISMSPAVPGIKDRLSLRAK